MINFEKIKPMMKFRKEDSVQRNLPIYRVNKALSIFFVFIKFVILEEE